MAHRKKQAFVEPVKRSKAQRRLDNAAMRGGQDIVLDVHTKTHKNDRYYDQRVRRSQNADLRMLTR